VVFGGAFGETGGSAWCFIAMKVSPPLFIWQIPGGRTTFPAGIDVSRELQGKWRKSNTRT